MSGAIGVFIPHLGCKHKCTFCNQNVIAATALPTPPKAICDIKPPKSPKDTELAFFGGSFTAIDRHLMMSYLEAGQQYVEKHGLKGIRLSTRPDAIDDEICEILVRYNVSTVEIGAQSMDDNVLALCERGHTKEDVVQAAVCIKKAKIPLVLQMMTGLLGDTDDTEMRTAESLAQLEPCGVRIYPTLVLKGSALAENENYRPQTVAEAVALCKKLVLYFDSLAIPVIKIGLHASEGYEKGELLAGPYHPAFRELVHGEIYLEEAIKATDGLCGDITVTVGKGRASQLAGQGGKNRQHLLSLPQINSIKITEDENITGFNVVAAIKM